MTLRAEVPRGCEEKVRNLSQWRYRRWACHIGKALAIEAATPLISLLEYCEKYHFTRYQVMRFLQLGELQGQKGKGKRILVTDKEPESWQGFMS